LNNFIDLKKDEMIEELKKIISFKSVSEETDIEGMPFGEECKKVLDYVLDLGENFGFRTKNLNGYCGYIEFGDGEEMVGIIGHLDVVPAKETDGWTSSPFLPEIRNNKLYGRGAIDDKGPVIASLYAMKAVAENCKVNKRVRLILGVNEEKNWKCINYYKQNEEAPTIGFSPDADFPCIYAEKGIVTIMLEHEFSMDNIEILEVDCANNAINVVPKYCSMTLKLHNLEDKARFVDKDGVHIEYLGEDKIKVIATGVAAHAAHPTLGDNAISKLLKYLGDIWYVNKLNECGFFELESPKCFGGSLTTDESGVLTSNISQIKYENGKLKLYTNLRVPVKTDFDKIRNYCEEMKADITGLEYNLEHSQNNLYVEKDNYLVKTLTEIFNSETGYNSEPIAIGGGTYARAFKNCVSFGLNFPGDKDMCHQVDEFVDIDKLISGAKIYAKAIYELAK